MGPGGKGAGLRLRPNVEFKASDAWTRMLFRDLFGRDEDWAEEGRDPDWRV